MFLTVHRTGSWGCTEGTFGIGFPPGQHSAPSPFMEEEPALCSAHQVTPVAKKTELASPTLRPAGPTAQDQLAQSGTGFPWPLLPPLPGCPQWAGLSCFLYSFLPTHGKRLGSGASTPPSGFPKAQDSIHMSRTQEPPPGFIHNAAELCSSQIRSSGPLPVLGGARAQCTRKPASRRQQTGFPPHSQAPGRSGQTDHWPSWSVLPSPGGSSWLRAWGC